MDASSIEAYDSDVCIVDEESPSLPQSSAAAASAEPARSWRPSSEPASRGTASAGPLSRVEPPPPQQGARRSLRGVGWTTTTLISLLGLKSRPRTRAEQLADLYVLDPDLEAANQIDVDIDDNADDELFDTSDDDEQATDDDADDPPVGDAAADHGDDAMSAAQPWGVEPADSVGDGLVLERGMVSECQR